MGYPSRKMLYLINRSFNFCLIEEKLAHPSLQLTMVLSPPHYHIQSLLNHKLLNFSSDFLALSNIFIAIDHM